MLSELFDIIMADQFEYNSIKHTLVKKKYFYNFLNLILFF